MTAMNQQAVWRKVSHLKLPDSIRGWLAEQGSLTQRFQRTCSGPLNVQLLSYGWQRALLEESQLLQQLTPHYLWHRHVHLRDGEQNDIFARTVVPHSTYQLMRYRLNKLNNRPLGEMLFTDNNITRGEIEVTCLKPQHKLYQLAVANLSYQPAKLWARRSCFYLKQMPLLVTEVFLPSDKWSDG